MPMGQMIGAISEVAPDAYLDIKPPSGTEYVIHNITVDEGASFELYFSNGTLDINIESGTMSIVDVHYHASNALYYRVKNTSDATVKMGYDGVIVYEG